jgi:hypothetical protein
MKFDIAPVATKEDVMRRGKLVCVFVLLMPAFAMPESPQGSWNNLSQLTSGQKVRIVLNGAKAYMGEFRSVNESGIVVRGAAGEQVFDRQNVRRVSTKGISHRGRNALIGAAVAGGIGAVGGGACDYREVIPCGGSGAAMIGAVSAGWGALVGALIPTGRWHDVYRAQ